MRSVLLLVLALAGCGGGDRDETPAASQTVAVGAADDGRIFCRIGNARQFERFCTVERGESEAGPTLTIRRPDGGFRRLVVTRDGRGVAAADGAEPARVAIIDGGRIEVAIGGDRFRLPATVRAR